MTVWKQAFFLGGAVVLLAACDQATGPSDQLRQKAPGAANLIIRRAPTTTTTTSSDSVPNLDDICRGGYYNVNSGRESLEALCGTTEEPTRQ